MINSKKYMLYFDPLTDIHFVISQKNIHSSYIHRSYFRLRMLYAGKCQNRDRVGSFMLNRYQVEKMSGSITTLMTKFFAKRALLGSRTKQLIWNTRLILISRLENTKSKLYSANVSRHFPTPRRRTSLKKSLPEHLLWKIFPWQKLRESSWNLFSENTLEKCFPVSQLYARRTS